LVLGFFLLQVSSHQVVRASSAASAARASASARRKPEPSHAALSAAGRVRFQQVHRAEGHPFLHVQTPKVRDQRTGNRQQAEQKPG
jgi:hypothetical protein